EDFVAVDEVQELLDQEKPDIEHAMVRIYKRKIVTKYSEENLREAVEAVRKKIITSYTAAVKYSIPRSTIIHRLYGTRGAKQSKPGKPTAISKDQETKIASYIHTMEKCGFLLTKKDILSWISEYIRKNDSRVIQVNKVQQIHNSVAKKGISKIEKQKSEIVRDPKTYISHTSVWSDHLKILYTKILTPAKNKENDMESFEKIPLQSIARNYPPKITKKLINSGAEVVNYKSSIERIRKEKEEKEKTGKKANRNKGQRTYLQKKLKKLLRKRSREHANMKHRAVQVLAHITLLVIQSTETWNLCIKRL
ncbi:jg26433, partial [Pararge aegeria aegeria]